MNKNQNQNKNRSRGRNSNRQRSSRGNNFESSGPEVKVRGTAQQVLDKYLQLARDANLSGDRVTAEGYQQYAEHYYRLINADAPDGAKKSASADGAGADAGAGAGGGDHRKSRGRQQRPEQKSASRTERANNRAKPANGADENKSDKNASTDTDKDTDDAKDIKEAKRAKPAARRKESSSDVKEQAPA